MDTFLIAGSLMSMALGAGMAGFAWKVIRANQRREAARVQLLTSHAFPNEEPMPAASLAPVSSPAPLPVHAAANDRGFSLVQSSGAEEFLSEEDDLTPDETPEDLLFSEPPTSGAAVRRRNSFAAVAVAVTIVISMYAWVHSVSAPSETTTVAVEPVAPQDTRVELLALKHDRKPASTFVVSGRVRNPDGGEPLRNLIAVVEVFDAGGRVVAAVRAPIDLPALDPGASSAFSVTAADVKDVAKYRVEFHGAGDKPIAHVDLRERAAGN